ncbi:polyisoprenoid diphosphate/phosphate phosphohydrolase PLPP6 [Phlebotomus argentipes]|uniref:polyisoprenoid diphosphate/phosphate phosphohydrolase PLPP6 n=1 Tax=Phlebotomus argentipes TaxID=94469 RepID=UPI00289342B8|nr:polyisoprenoid diphosphate/phosphate phosphohydrolase PLPP6 [Phlebotomus argentipes]
MSEKKNEDLQKEDKRQLPPYLKKILAWDVELTKRFVSFMLNFVSVRSVKNHGRFLEISCHGIIILVLWFILTWMIDDPELYEMQINLLIGLLLDIVIIACIKAATRRHRPSFNDDPFSIGPDKFSFPSGHASRAVFMAAFFTLLSPLPMIFWPPLVAWATAVCFSRLLMYRHHILDVLAGAVLGLLEAFLLSLLWCDRETSLGIMKWISDDKYVEGQTGI